jgi:hypothetical protein
VHDHVRYYYVAHLLYIVHQHNSSWHAVKPGCRWQYHSAQTEDHITYSSCLHSSVHRVAWLLIYRHRAWACRCVWHHCTHVHAVLAAARLQASWPLRFMCAQEGRAVGSLLLCSFVLCIATTQEWDRRGYRVLQQGAFTAHILLQRSCSTIAPSYHSTSGVITTVLAYCTMCCL